MWGARMHASHSWSVCSHSIVQTKKTPLMYAARNESAQAPAVVKLLLQGKADVDAADSVSACEGDSAGCENAAVTGVGELSVISVLGRVCSMPRQSSCPHVCLSFTVCVLPLDRAVQEDAAHIRS